MSGHGHAVVFDLDGVITDTAELHYLSWQALADSLGMPFDRQANESMRGLSREESLVRFLGQHYHAFTPDQRADLLVRKNDDYLARVAAITPGDVFRGVPELLKQLKAANFRRAIASSSRNARLVIERLGVGDCFDVIVDGQDAPRSKPDPLVFLLAAARLGVPAAACVVVEDAVSGVEAAQRAGMKVIGIGSPATLAAADLVAPATGDLSLKVFLDLLGLAIA